MKTHTHTHTHTHTVTIIVGMIVAFIPTLLLLVYTEMISGVTMEGDGNKTPTAEL